MLRFVHFVFCFQAHLSCFLMLITLLKMFLLLVGFYVVLDPSKILFYLSLFSFMCPLFLSFWRFLFFSFCTCCINLYTPFLCSHDMRNYNYPIVKTNWMQLHKHLIYNAKIPSVSDSSIDLKSVKWSFVNNYRFNRGGFFGKLST